jgi:hypothetical protein
LTIYLKVWIWGKLLNKDNTRGRSLPKPLSSHSPPELRSGREREREKDREREPSSSRNEIVGRRLELRLGRKREKERERERERTVAD